MLNARSRATLFALTILIPATSDAQRDGGPRLGRMGGGGNPVAPLIDMRRELNLSGRQLAQLDSIERSLLQRNEGVRQRLRTRVDSLRPRTRGSEEEIAAFRAQGDSMRVFRQVMVRNDSVARIAAMNVLTDSQRVRVRERAAERRGFEMGRRSTMRGQRGMQGGRQGNMGPRMRGQGGRPGMDRQGVRPRGGMRGPDGFGPGIDDRRRQMPDDGVGPMGRGFRGRDGAPQAGDSLSQRRRPMDDMGMRPRFRRPPPDSGR